MLGEKETRANYVALIRRYIGQADLVSPGYINCYLTVFG